MPLNSIDNDVLRQKYDTIFAEKGIQGVIEKLTTKQLAFAKEYSKDYNPTDAALRAGYELANRNNAAKFAFNMLGHPGIVMVLKHYSRLVADKSPIDVTYVINKVTETIRKSEDPDKYNPTAVLRACELLAKHLGMFVERTEITGKDGSAIQYEKIQNDADEFTRSIAKLANRSGAERLSLVPNTGTEG